MWYISGNRDEEKINRADEFIIDRAKPRQHVSFGAGIQRCVGDPLAEQKLRILWEEILQRNLRFEIVGAQKRLYSNFVHETRVVPVGILCERPEDLTRQSGPVRPLPARTARRISSAEVASPTGDPFGTKFAPDLVLRDGRNQYAPPCCQH